MLTQTLLQGLPLALIAFGGLLLTTYVGGAIVGALVRPYQNVELREGLPNAGRKIGLLERALIFILVLAGEPGAIGFLIAAKSILRFDVAAKGADEESRARAQRASEYVIIGTLASFAWALFISFATAELLEIVRNAP